MKNFIIKIVIVLGIFFLLFLVALNIFNYFKIKELKEKNTKIMEENDLVIEAYDVEFQSKNEEIKRLKKEKETLTRDQINNIPYKELKEKYYKVQTDRDIYFNNWEEEVKTSKKLRDQLEKSNKQLEENNKILDELKKPFGIDLYVMGGLNENIKPDVIAGMDFRRNFGMNRAHLSIGGWVKPIETVAGGLKIGGGFSFGKGK